MTSPGKPFALVVSDELSYKSLAALRSWHRPNELILDHVSAVPHTSQQSRTGRVQPLWPVEWSRPARRFDQHVATGHAVRITKYIVRKVVRARIPTRYPGRRRGPPSKGNGSEWRSACKVTTQFRASAGTSFQLSATPGCTAQFQGERRSCRKHRGSLARSPHVDLR